MSDFIPKPGGVQTGVHTGVKIGGLSRKAQKLQTMREKAAAQGKNGGKPLAAAASGASLKAKDTFANTKKTTFQRKAV